jgi:hypothetical protein
MLPGYYYCAGIASSSTSSAPPPSATTTAAYPTQTGIAPNCDSYHLVTPGSHCSTLEI